MTNAFNTREPGLLHNTVAAFIDSLGPIEVGSEKAIAAHLALTIALQIDDQQGPTSLLVQRLNEVIAALSADRPVTPASSLADVLERFMEGSADA